MSECIDLANGLSQRRRDASTRLLVADTKPLRERVRVLSRIERELGITFD